MNKIEYRKAKPADAGIIAALAERIWKKHYITIITMEQIEYMLEKMYSEESLISQMNEGHDFTIASMDGIDIGYISLSTKDGKKYFLHKFYVEMAEQGKGLGTEMFAHILKSLANAETIKLTVNRANYKAINFYFKNDFVIDQVADFDIGEGYFMNDFVMLRKIK